MIEVRLEGRIYEPCSDIPKLGEMAHLSIDEGGYYVVA